VGVPTVCRRRAPWLALLLAAGCSSTAARDPWPADRAESERAIGWIDGDPVTYGDLARFLRARDALTFSRILDALIVDGITRREAEFARVDVPRAIVERSTRGRYLAFEERLKAATKERAGEALDPAVWLRRTLGLTPEEFRLYLRAQIEVELLQNRLIRYAQLRAPTVEVSLIVVEGKDRADSLRRRLDAGEAFGVLAREASGHTSAERGGRIEHRMLAEDFDDETVARLLFAAEPGAILGPFAREADGRTFFRLYRLEERHAGRDEPYAELARAVEADLEKRPVSMGEYIDWRRRMQERHGFLPATAGPATADE